GGVPSQPKGSEKQPEEDVKLIRPAKAALEQMIEAMSNGNYGKVVDLTHPRLVEKEGGRERMTANMKWVMEDTNSNGFTGGASTVGEANQLLRTPKGVFVVFPISTELTGMGGKVAYTSVAVGISEDGGKTWTFVSNPPAVKKHLPDLLPDKLQFPDVLTSY